MNGVERLMLLDWTRKIHTMEYAHRLESIVNAELEMMHCVIGAKLENLRHTCEAALCCNGADTDDIRIILSKWNEIDKPNVSDENFKKASDIVKELGSYPEKGIKYNSLHSTDNTINLSGAIQYVSDKHTQLEGFPCLLMGDVAHLLHIITGRYVSFDGIIN